MITMPPIENDFYMHIGIVCKLSQLRIRPFKLHVSVLCYVYISTGGRAMRD